MLSENQRVILKDAIDTLQHINEAAGIKDYRERVKETVELINRAEDDIRTVLRTDK